MNWSLLFFLNSALFGVGLAMDAFSVSLADGLLEPHMRRRKVLGIAGLFGLFQAAMPVLGWVLVHTLAHYFDAFLLATPWIALVLLCLIGGNMIREGLKGDAPEEGVKQLGMGVLLLQAVATSIDALSVGLSMARYTTAMALVSALIIGVITTVLCVFGLLAGRKAGTRFAGKAHILGGVILVLLGIEICVTGILT